MPARFGSSKKAFLAAFKATRNVVEAAASTNTSRSLHYRRLKEDPAYKQAFERISADEAPPEQFDSGTVKALRHEILTLQNRITKLGSQLRRRISALEATPTTPRIRRQPPEEVDPLLDQLAHGMAKKRFSKLSPLHQDTVRMLAEKLRMETPD